MNRPAVNNHDVGVQIDAEITAFDFLAAGRADVNHQSISVAVIGLGGGEPAAHPPVDPDRRLDVRPSPPCFPFRLDTGIHRREGRGRMLCLVARSKFFEELVAFFLVQANYLPMAVLISDADLDTVAVGADG